MHSVTLCKAEINLVTLDGADPCNILKVQAFFFLIIISQGISVLVKL